MLLICMHIQRNEEENVLNQVCQAAVLAVKACILVLFGNKAQQEALKCIKAAIELDPDELGIRKGAWYCLAGRTLAEIRNNQSHHQMPSLEERKFLERSIEKDPFPIHYVYLADTYRQIAKMLLQQSFKNNKEEAEEMSKKARRMYEDAVNDENATIGSLVRSGAGLIKLSKQFRNVELAKVAFNKVLSIDPNHTAALIGMGNMLHWCMNDYKEALKYFEKASLFHPMGGNIIKASSLIFMKSMIDENYNPLEDCDKYLEKEMEMCVGLGREESAVYYHVVKAEYFLVKNKDLMEAARCWEKAISSFPSAKEIWEYQCLFAKDKRSKLSKMLVDEINLALQQRMDKSDVEYLRKILRLSNSSSENSSKPERK
ncbi:hypothetical protein J437_LFUL004619 [Ladona fulva]|uniref:Cell division cycle protein 27 homolog n=1 Tax=Ladona fulva TaxID=123851 RepID=A0A8K0K0G6_LADFU|nr:hypothetical protein J437_LFUL004619 [Ladona fulva]